MAGAREIKAGEAFVVISAKMDSLRADLRKTQNEMRTWGSNLSNIGGMISGLWAGLTTGAAAGAFASMVKAFADTGSALNDMSARTGRSAQDLQHLKFAAEATGASFNDVELALRTMAKNGLSVADFERLGQEIAAIPDPSERAARALETFGKSGTRLLPMLESWNGLKQASQSVGLVLSDEEVAAADKLGDSFGVLLESLRRLQVIAGSAFGQTLIELTHTAIGATNELAIAMREMNESGRGGDWLDKWAGFMQQSNISNRFARNTGLGMLFPSLADYLFPPGDVKKFEKVGAQITSAMSAVGKTSPLDEMDEIASKTAADAARREEAVWNAIRSAHERRNDLIQGFETPAERFIRRQRELVDAFKELHRARLLNEIGEGEAITQQRGLQTAMARLQAEEMRRVAEERERMMAAAAGSAASMRTVASGGAVGSSNAAVARLLGRAGDAQDRKMDESINILRKIEKNTGRTVGGVAFS